MNGASLRARLVILGMLFVLPAVAAASDREDVTGRSVGGYAFDAAPADVLLGAPSAGGGYYGMYCPSPCLAASFTLTSSYDVSTIDIVLRTPANTSFTNFDFALQDSLSGSITTFATGTLIVAPGTVSTQPIRVDAILPAGTYYLVGGVPGYAGTTVTPGDVDGWLLSNAVYDETAGTITDGLWGAEGSTWTLTSGDHNPGYHAPAFTVHGSPAGGVSTTTSSTTSTTGPINTETTTSTTTTATSTTSPESEPTTTLPCTSVRCTLSDTLAGSACADQTIPASVTTKLSNAEDLIDEAAIRPGRRAGKIRRKAKKLLRRAAVNATRAAKGRSATLSADCAAAVKDAAEAAVIALGEDGGGSSDCGAPRATVSVGGRQVTVGSHQAGYTTGLGCFGGDCVSIGIALDGQGLHGVALLLHDYQPSDGPHDFMDDCSALLGYEQRRSPATLNADVWTDDCPAAVVTRSMNGAISGHFNGDLQLTKGHGRDTIHVAGTFSCLRYTRH